MRSASRSGPLTDDCVEAPLSDKVARFTNALTISNRLLDSMLSGDLRAACQECVLPEYQGAINSVSLSELLRNNQDRWGVLKSYKKWQWGFVSVESAGRRYICSVKIVEHERCRARYYFCFPDDGVYDRIASLSVWPYTRVLPPGVLFEN